MFIFFAGSRRETNDWLFLFFTYFWSFFCWFQRFIRLFLFFLFLMHFLLLYCQSLLHLFVHKLRFYDIPFGFIDEANIFNQWFNAVLGNIKSNFLQNQSYLFDLLFAILQIREEMNELSFYSINILFGEINDSIWVTIIAIIRSVIAINI